jgi:hypothetical protein
MNLRREMPFDWSCVCSAIVSLHRWISLSLAATRAIPATDQFAGKLIRSPGCDETRAPESPSDRAKFEALRGPMGARISLRRD